MKVLISGGNEVIYKVGDVVASNSCPRLHGTIVRLSESSKTKGLALIRTPENKNLLIALDRWHHIDISEKEKENASS